jgi:proton-dependent oligopeptide transporter, POT family
MAAGHFMMAFEALFLPALACRILGFGAFKPNISTQAGALYSTDDQRRSRGYPIFYVGINIGAFLARSCAARLRSPMAGTRALPPLTSAC